MLAFLACWTISAELAVAGSRVVVLGLEAEAEVWCALLTTNGFECSTFAAEGPAGPLDPYDVVVALNVNRPNEGSEIADYLSTGKGVLWWSPVIGGAFSLSDPVVRSWAGFDSIDSASASAIAIATSDPAFGSLAAGTELLEECLNGFCPAMFGVGNHPNAIRLAEWRSGNMIAEPAAVRNDFGGGTAITVGMHIAPEGSAFAGIASPLSNQLLVSAVRELAGQSVPSASGWGLLTLAIALSTAGTMVSRKRFANLNREPSS